ncbi:MAG TPA: hypothetical protein VFF72_07790 [Caldimonas sp.]|nr:hypothetical protein [Caldimonas sp.]
MRVVRFGSSNLRRSLLSVALGLGVAALSTQAFAACGGWPGAPAKSSPSRWEVPTKATGGFMNIAYRPGDGRFVPVDLRESFEGIVGTWRFTWTSDGNAYPHPVPYGAQVDFGTHQWHSDRTEMFTSGSRPPSSGDICMGVWKQTGRFTYKMRHIALAWLTADTIPPSNPPTYQGPAIMTETVTLNRAGDRYEGTFTIDQYAPDETTLIEHVSGKVEATRFTIE